MASAETLVFTALLSELKDRMGPEVENVLLAVGVRIGEVSRFDLEGGLETFTVTMNDIWSELGMGQAELSLSPQGLDIVHILPPHLAGEGHWREALPKIIEGIYKGWFRHLDPKGQLTRKAGSGRELEFFFLD